MVRHRMVSVLLLIVILCVAQETAAASYAEEFKGISTVTTANETSVKDIQGLDQAELERYTEEVLFTALKARMPAALKVSRDSVPADALITAQVWVGKTSTGHYGAVRLNVKRSVRLAFTPDSKPFSAIVYEGAYTIVGPGKVDEIKTQVRTCIDELVMAFASALYDARPDL